MQLKNIPSPPLLLETCIALFSSFLFLCFLTLLPKINLFMALHTNQNHNYILHYYTKTKPEKAMQYTIQSANTYPNNPFYQMEAGVFSFQSGDLKTANTYLKKAGDLFYFPYTQFPYILSDSHCEKMAEVYFLYGHIFLNKNLLSGALFYFQYSSDISPEYFPKKIKPLLKDYVKQNDVTESSHLLLAGFYIQEKDFQSALFHLNLSQENQKDFHLLKGKILDGIGDKDGANSMYTQESLLFPDNLSIYTYNSIPDSKIMKERGFVPLLKKERLIRSEHTTVTEDLNPLDHGDVLIQYRIASNHPAESRYYVFARGTPAKGIWPILEVSLNNNPPYLIYINDSLWRAYPLNLDWKAGENIITLRFINDGVYGYQYDEKTGKGLFAENRDLFVNNIWYYKDE